MGIAGNDAVAARQESTNQYGEHATAEDLIKAHEYAFDAPMQAALSKPVDGAATEALDVDKIEPKYDGGEVQSAAVRGGHLIVVEMVNGQLVKWSDPDFVKGSAVRQATRQAAASVGGDPKKQGGAPEARGVTGGTPPDSTSGATQQSGADGTSRGPVDTGDKAPEKVTVPVIKDKLDALQIQPASDVRTKDALWALLPADSKKELEDAASA